LERFARPIAEVSPIAKELTASSLTLRASAGNAGAAKRPLIRSVSSSSGFRPKAARRCVRSAVDPATVSHDHLPAITKPQCRVEQISRGESGVPEGVPRWSTANSIGPGFPTDHGNSLAVGRETRNVFLHDANPIAAFDLRAGKRTTAKQQSHPQALAGFSRRWIIERNEFEFVACRRRPGRSHAGQRLVVIQMSRAKALSTPATFLERMKRRPRSRTENVALSSPRRSPCDSCLGRPRLNDVRCLAQYRRVLCTGRL
jgi:hypothetical protein